MITFDQIQAFVTVILGISAFIGAIVIIVTAAVRYWKFAHRQSDENTEDLKEVMKYLKSDKERIEKLEKNQEVFKEENKLMLRALAKLLSHEIDGNHTEQLIEIHDEIMDYLFDRKL